MPRLNEQQYIEKLEQQIAERKVKQRESYVKTLGVIEEKKKAKELIISKANQAILALDEERDALVKLLAETNGSEH